MSTYLVLVYLHILSAIFWIGYALYWFFVIAPLRRDFDEKTGRNLILQIDGATWPPPPLPSPIRLRFSQLGAASIAVLIVTGLIMLPLRGFTLHEITSGQIFRDGLGLLGLGKMLLISLMLFIEYSQKERGILQSRLVFTLSLLIAGISVMLVR